MFQMQQNMIFIRPDPTAFVNFNCHGTAHHIAASQIFAGWGIAFHKSLAFGIGHIPAFAACAFGDQNTRAVNAGWVELNKLHILKRKSGA